MTSQLSQRFINNHQDFTIEGFNLYCISVSEPKDYKNWVAYPIKSEADPQKLNVFTACWDGHIKVYELNSKGKLILIQIEYPSFDNKIEPDSVYELLEGDFWLEFRAGFSGDKLFVPFIDGQLVTDKNKWVSDQKNLTSQPIEAKRNWLASLRNLF